MFVRLLLEALHVELTIPHHATPCDARFLIGAIFAARSLYAGAPSLFGDRIERCQRGQATGLVAAEERAVSRVERAHHEVGRVSSPSGGFSAIWSM